VGVYRAIGFWVACSPAPLCRCMEGELAVCHAETRLFFLSLESGRKLMRESLDEKP
jgi:hypothetical protein